MSLIEFIESKPKLYYFGIMKPNDAVTTLSALAQETRLRIFRELVKAHTFDDGVGMLGSDLVKKLNVPHPTLSFHLKEMTHAHLLSSRREGRSIIYKANFKTMQGLINYLLEDCCEGECGTRQDAVKQEIG